MCLLSFCFSNSVPRQAPNKKDLKGTIELKEAKAIESSAIKDKKLIVLELQTPRAKKAQYFVQMPTKEALEDWIRAINIVIEQCTVRPLTCVWRYVFCCYCCLSVCLCLVCVYVCVWRNSAYAEWQTTRRMTAVKPPYEGPLILAETRAIANEALMFVQLLKVLH